jgi:hypothetical protein
MAESCELRRGPHDHGALNVGLTIEVSHDRPVLVLDFGAKSISWFSMSPDEADAFADKLKRMAKLARVPTPPFGGTSAGRH